MKILGDLFFGIGKFVAIPLDFWDTSFPVDGECAGGEESGKNGEENFGAEGSRSDGANGSRGEEQDGFGDALRGGLVDGPGRLFRRVCG